jgi:hypothetical protein
MSLVFMYFKTVGFLGSSLVVSSYSIRPSGSETLPGGDEPEAEAMEDVSTCEVTDFPGMSSIPEGAAAAGEDPFAAFIDMFTTIVFCV